MKKLLGLASLFALSFAALACGDDATTPNPDAGTTTPTCASYCTTIMGACTAGNAQYASMEACMGACAGFPVGTAADKAGNTLGCRAYHAGVAATMAADTHCPHAGPSGEAVCGTACEGFCSIQASACTGTNQVYTSNNDCMTQCATIAAGTGPFNTSHTADDSILCRTYHLSVAASDATSAATHCPHTAVVSPVCTQ